jgi:hypothetical protein
MTINVRTLTLRFAVPRELLLASVDEVQKLVAEGEPEEQAINDEADDLMVQWMDIIGDEIDDAVYERIYSILKSEVEKAKKDAK